MTPGPSPVDEGPDLPIPGETSNPNLLPPNEVFNCQSPADAMASTPRLRRLTGAEWSEKRKEFVASRSSDGNPLVPPPNNRYSTYDAQDVMDVATTERMLEVALWTAQQFDGSRNHRCLEDDTLEDGCLAGFVRDQIRRAWRRPASDEETTAHVELLRGWMEQFERMEAVRLAVAAIWAAPESLYRTELGLGAPDGSGRNHLSDHEIAQAVALALTDGRGDGRPQSDALDALFEAADAGELHTAQQVETHVRALLRREKDDGWEPAQKTRRFFFEYFGLDAADEVFKDAPKATSKYRNGSFAPDYFARFSWSTIEEILVSDENVLEELLTRTEVYAFEPDHSRNKVYGTYDEESGTSPGGRIDLAGRRAGVLTHPAWLSAWGHNTENDSSPVRRGKWVLENLLCGAVPDLPINVAAVLPDEPEWSARKRLAYATEPLPTDSAEARAEKDYCWQCHKLMNPLGLPFEIFNHAGFEREWDHEGEPNGSATLVATGDPNLDGRTVRDALELTELLSKSPVVEQCFVRQVFRFYAGRPESPADACTLSQMLEAYRTNGGSFEEMLVALLTSDTFRYREEME